MITGNFKLLKTDQMTAQLTIQFTIGEWKIIKEGLRQNYHMTRIELANDIEQMISKAEEQFSMIHDLK